MDFFDVATSTPTVRRFSPRPIEQRDLERVLETANMAPSGSNAQPWEFVIVREASARREIQKMYRASWEPYKESAIIRGRKTLSPRAQKALSIGDDLALIIAGQLRQTGPASQVAAEPAAADAARLLGWSELGRGTTQHQAVRAGQLFLPDARPPGIQGPVHIFYRPEDVVLGTPAPDAPAGASLTAQITQVLPTRPLARVSLASDPPITALMLHRDLERLRLQAGTSATATLPAASVRVFPPT